LEEVFKIWHDVKTKLTNKDFFSSSYPINLSILSFIKTPFIDVFPVRERICSP